MEHSKQKLNLGLLTLASNWLGNLLLGRVRKVSEITKRKMIRIYFQPFPWWAVVMMVIGILLLSYGIWFKPS